MIRINLLPHREQKRQARQRQFVSLSIGLAILGLALVALGWVILGAQIESQESRNALLKSEIAKLDEQIKEIDKLREQTQALLARKQVVETLQSNRTEAVHVLDQMVRQLPDGIYLKSLKQVGAQDHARRLRAVERASLDADAQHRLVALAPQSRSWSRSSSVPSPAREGPAGQRVHAQRPDQAARGAGRAQGARPRRGDGSAGAPAAPAAAAGGSAPPPPGQSQRRERRMTLDDIRRLNIREVGNWPVLPQGRAPALHPDRRSSRPAPCSSGRTSTRRSTARSRKRPSSRSSTRPRRPRRSITTSTSSS